MAGRALPPIPVMTPIAGRFALVIVACHGVAPMAAAQSYPAKPVRLVVAFAAGGASDVVARMIAPRLGEALGQQVVVDNRAGANGIIGSELVAKSAPDGYTVLMATNGTHTVNPSLYAKLPYDAVGGFGTVSQVVALSNLLVIHPSIPATSVKDLIGLARARPNQLQYGSGGSGGTPHLAGELLASMTGVKLLHVPYKGGGPSTTALLAGEVAMTFNTLLTSLPHARAGRVRALGVTGRQRSAAIAEVPTIAEAGVPGYEATTWYGLMVPAGTPMNVIERLHLELGKVLRIAEVRERLLGLGADPVGDTPAQFAIQVREDTQKWAKLIREAGVKLQ